MAEPGFYYVCVIKTHVLNHLPQTDTRCPTHMLLAFNIPVCAIGNSIQTSETPPEGFLVVHAGCEHPRNACQPALGLSNTCLKLPSVLAPFSSLSHSTSLLVLLGITSHMTIRSHIFYSGSSLGRTQPKILASFIT